MGADRLANAKAQAQDYAQTAQQRAAEHLDRVSLLSLLTLSRASCHCMSTPSGEKCSSCVEDSSRALSAAACQLLWHGTQRLQAAALDCSSAQI